MSSGKRMLIDGQQRVTALMAAILGQEVLNDDYETIRIAIAYNPFPGPDENRFEVRSSAHVKSRRWISDISVLFEQGYNAFTFIPEYCKDNPDIDMKALNSEIDRLRNIVNLSIGVIELSHDLDVATVTEIFVRINSKGVVLDQSDFVMSKMSSDSCYGGELTRKTIDHFCHILRTPSFFENLRKVDPVFFESRGSMMRWVSMLPNPTIYQPGYDDLLRVAFMYGFRKSKMADLVSLLSGRNFETKTYEESIAEDTYSRMDAAVMDAINMTTFKEFLVCISSTGFIVDSLIRSRMSIDFAYALYLILLHSPDVKKSKVNAFVGRWFVMSVLTGRYSSSPESNMGRDLRLLEEKGLISSIEEIESAELSDAFWNLKLVQNLESHSNINPAYHVFVAAQVHDDDRSLLTSGTKVSTLVGINAGDVHHIFPKNYLKEHGFKQSEYNEVANYAYIDKKLNINISDDAPCEYFSKVRAQCNGASVSYGDISDSETLKRNLEANCIPEDIFEMDYTRYEEFLVSRRHLMAQKIERYYSGLIAACK